MRDGADEDDAAVGRHGHVVDRDGLARLARRELLEAVVEPLLAAEERPPVGVERGVELPVGRDGGYLWRLNTYWRLLERDEGTYLQCESVSLTRGIPTGLGWLVGPFVTSIPRESLAFTLETTARAVRK